MNERSPHNRLHPVSAIAAVFRIAPIVVYRKIKTGEFPAHRVGRRVLLNIDEILTATRPPVTQRIPGEIVDGK